MYLELDIIKLIAYIRDCHYKGNHDDDSDYGDGCLMSGFSLVSMITNNVVLKVLFVRHLVWRVVITFVIKDIQVFQKFWVEVVLIRIVVVIE